MLVFAENFQQDVSETIIHRYPETVYAQSPVTVPDQCFPINTAAQLELGTVPFTSSNKRLEVFLHLGTGLEPITETVTDKTWSVLGVDFGAPYTDNTISVSGHPVPKFTDAVTLNLIVEKEESGDYLLSLFINDTLVLRKATLPNYTPTSKIGAAEDDAAMIEGLPAFIADLAVIVDGSDTSRVTKLTNFKRGLTVGDTGAWTYTDKGYVQDVDKANPTTLTPRIQTTEYSTIKYAANDVGTGLAGVYANAASSEPDQAVTIDGVKYPIYVDLQVMPKTKLKDNAIEIIAEDVWVSNGLGLEYAGEYHLVDYLQLAEMLHFDHGTPLPNNSWLRVRLDGVEMFVSKTPVRDALCWNDLYQAGLVYGTDDNGKYPSGTPTNQLQVVTIHGENYKVRLLRGAAADPAQVTSNGNDPKGAYGSEWNRIFYALAKDKGTARYAGPMLANFHPVELGMSEAAGDGRISICQETQSSDLTLRIGRGNTGPSDLGRDFTTSKGAIMGWRVVLEKIK